MGAALLGFIVVLLAAAGCGMALLRALRAESDSPAEQFVMGAAVGLGLLAYAILAAGLLGYLRLPALLALVLIEGAVGAKSLIAWVRSVARTGGCRQRLDPVATALLVYCLFITACMLVGALAPPSGDDWDSLSYHLAAPKIYLAHGRIVFIPYDSHTDFPFTMEMLYTLGLSCGGAAGAKLFHWGAAWLTALGVAAFVGFCMWAGVWDKLKGTAAEKANQAVDGASTGLEKKRMEVREMGKVHESSSSRG